MSGQMKKTGSALLLKKGRQKRNRCNRRTSAKDSKRPLGEDSTRLIERKRNRRSQKKDNSERTCDLQMVSGGRKVLGDDIIIPIGACELNLEESKMSTNP